MNISPALTDEAVLQELGGRLAAARLAANLTQAGLAEQAGVSKRSIERLEAGEVATQLSGFIRVCRALGLLERLDNIVPEPQASPLARLKLQKRRRQRASGRKAKAAGKPKKWTWAEP